ncbi:hypothetical protein MCOR12_008645 [Pyricularia oryzae]|nr:hypothetical protein MCOR12_008645 [Pyricularia oryzae]
MPSVTQQEPMVCTSKKRRRGDDDGAESEENRHVYNSAVQYKIATSLPRQHHYHAADRAILVSGGQILHQDEHAHNTFFARRTLVPLQAATKRPQLPATPARKIGFSASACYIYTCALSHLSTTTDEEIGLGLFCRL